MNPRLPLFILFVLLLVIGPVRADPLDDAVVVALEWTGDLEVDPTDVAAVADHIAWCRLAEPEVENIHVFASWVPGELLVKMTPDAYADFEVGDPTAMVELGNSLGPATYTPLGLTIVPRLVKIEFESPLHPERLEELFEALHSIEYADVNSIAGDGDDITRVAENRYVFRHGYGDCPAGCIYEIEWVFEIGEGQAVLLSRTSSGGGTDAPSLRANLQVGPPRPNPFNPRTEIELVLEREAHVRADLFDVAGRRVATLLDAALPTGSRSLVWDGTDVFGRRVASGSYLLRVRSGVDVVTRRVTLVE